MDFRGRKTGPAAQSGEVNSTRARSAAGCFTRAREAGCLVRAREAGNAVLQVIFILSVLIIAIYLIADKIQTHRNVVLQSGSVVQARFALHSALDYMYYAVQRRYCLTDNLLHEPNCSLKLGVTPGSRYGRSLERVLMSSEQAQNVQKMVNGSPACTAPDPNCPLQSVPAIVGVDLGLEIAPPNQITDIASQILRVDMLEVQVKVDDITGTHPLYPVLQSLKRVMRLELKDEAAYKALGLKLRVRVNREWGGHVYRTGNEVYFQVVVSLTDKSDKILRVNNTPLEVMSYGTLYQRELSSFALMIPRDLRLDGDTSTNPLGNGDVELPLVDGAFSGPGLVFKSPVFVNRDIRLPSVSKAQGGQKARNLAYSPVTFADRVVIGNGIVRQGSNPYKPDESGSRNSLLWSDNKLFGGFKAGLLVDGAFDRGLNVFGLVESAVPADGSLMAQCNQRNLLTTDVTKIREAKLIANLGATAPGRWTYRVGFTDGNYFMAQTASLGSPSAGAWGSNPSDYPPEFPDPEVVGATGGDGILELKVSLVDSANNVAFMADSIRLNKGGEARLRAQVASPEWKKKLEDRLQEILDEAPPHGPDWADRKKAAEDNVKALEELMKNPGEIKIKLAPWVKPGTTYDQKHAYVLTVEITNDNAFRDPVVSGEFPALLTPKVMVKGFDALHVEYLPISADVVPFITSNKTRWLKFARDGGGALEAPPTFSNTENGAPIDPAIPNDETDWYDVDKKCADARNAATGQSFGAAAWNIDFATTSTFRSWNYSKGLDQTPPSPFDPVAGPNDTIADPVTFGAAASESDPALITWYPDNRISRKDFDVISIAPSCRIKGNAKLITGFFTCHTLYIERRTVPLTIVGTFVVRKILFVEPDASDWSESAAKASLQQGIEWMSIYHPDATNILRNARVLRPKSDAAVAAQTPCSDNLPAGSAPIWAQSHRTGAQLQDFRACNVVSLRAKSNPHTWTAVDPDCGLPPGLAAGQMCKNRPVNFFVMEHARGGGP